MTELTKEKIVDVALNLFMTRGIRDVSIDEVCHELGISKKTFYVIYAEKENLVKDTVAVLFQKRREMLQDGIINRNPVDVLKILSEIIGNYGLAVSNYFRLMYDLKKYYPRTYEIVCSEDQNLSKKAVEKFINVGISEGFFRNDLDMDSCQVVLSILFEGFNSYVYDSKFSKKKKPSTAALAKCIVDIITHTVLSEKGWKEYQKDDQKKPVFLEKSKKNGRKMTENRILE